jgi:hypothetical protein
MGFLKGEGKRWQKGDKGEGLVPIYGIKWKVGI